MKMRKSAIGACIDEQPGQRILVGSQVTSRTRV